MILLLIQIARKSFKKDSSALLLRTLIVTEILICICDIIYAYFNGSSNKAARTIIQITNIGFLISSTVSSYIWVLYVNYRLENKKVDIFKVRFIAAIPLLIFILLALSNPFTEIFFSIDENNMYFREPLICIHWIVIFGYLIFATLKALIQLRKENSDKTIIIPLVLYIIPPTIASLVQIFFVQLSTVQVGIMFSILLIYLENQQNLVLKDDLTGTNNKRALLRYQSFLLDHHEKDNITVIMLDLDKFKSINDNYGHLEGDFALKATADLIEAAAHFSLIKMGLFRYGGDEFIAVGTNISDTVIQGFLTELENQLNSFNSSEKKKYKLYISSGYASAQCHSPSEFQALIKKADEEMYKNKEQNRVKNL